MSFAPILKQIAIEGVLSSASKGARVNTAGIAMFGLAGSLGFLGIVFLALSGYGLLLTEYDVPAAAGITAGVILFISAILTASGAYAMRRKKKSGLFKDARAQEVESIINMLFDNFITELEEPVRENPKTAMILAALAGLVAGDQLH